MVPFEVITNSRSRNYRAKSLLAQPRIGGPGKRSDRAKRAETAGEPARVGSAHTGGSRNAQALQQRTWGQLVTRSAIHIDHRRLRPGRWPTRSAEHSGIRGRTLKPWSAPISGPSNPR